MNTVIKKTGKTIFAALAVLAATAPLATSHASTGVVTRSISYSADMAMEKSERDARLDEAGRIEYDSLETSGPREESNSQMVIGARYTSAEITIYDASTELISDFNLDGFYHRFAVTIDADTIYPSSWIYAKLYLSYEGGPWSLYTISDDFHIHEDSEFDTYTVETELDEGFPPGYYDIRIELYDAEYGTRILGYGPYDDDSLAALPLEDSYYDDEYRDIVVPVATEVTISASGHGHGSMGLWLLAAPLLFSLRRLSTRRHIWRQGIRAGTRGYSPR